MDDNHHSEKIIEEFLNSSLEIIEIPTIDETDINYIREKAEFVRFQYKLGNVPISTRIFEFIKYYGDGSIRFELGSFKEGLDAAILSPTNSENDILIILNKNKPLIKQIFAATHELYHYIEDRALILNSPTACDLSKLVDKNEKMASRFAAEFLLPQKALKVEVEYLEKLKMKKMSQLRQIDIANFAFFLSIKYGIPIRASLIRMTEEKYIKTPKKSIVELIESAQAQFEDKPALSIVELFQKDNPYVKDDFEDTLVDLYRDGKITEYQIVRDSGVLGIDPDRIFRATENDDLEEDDEIEELLNLASNFRR